MPKNEKYKYQTTEQLREAVGRLLITGFEGCDYAEVEKLIVEVRPAGLIFFKRNYPGCPEKLRCLIAAAQELAEKRLGRRLFMAIDHEGGLVQRLPAPYTIISSAKDVSSLNPDPCKASEVMARGAEELAGTGFNFNMAPVLDVSPPGGGFIGSRSFSEDPVRISEMGKAYLSALHQAGILGAGKHFPGLGGAYIDPHHELPVIDTNLECLEEKDLPPFRDLISTGLAAVMTTHALYPALDPDYPATFSSRIVNLVKDDPAYSGAVITDDLEMGAVVKHYPMGEAAVKAVVAGHDLALVCRCRSYVDECCESLKEALAVGYISASRLADAHRRSSSLMDKLNAIRRKESILADWFDNLLKNKA